MDETLLEEIITENELKNRFKIIHIVIFSICTIYYFCDMVFFYDIQAPNKFFYRLSLIVHVLSESISCGYIFLFITSCIPAIYKRHNVRKNVNYYKNMLSNKLDELMQAVLYDRSWQESKDKDLYTKFLEFSNSRTVWTERLNFSTQDKYELICFDPLTLNTISRLLDELNDIFKSIIVIAEEIQDTSYLKDILLFVQTGFYQKIHICNDAAKSQIQLNDEKEPKNTYLDYFFQRDLSTLIFGNTNQDDNSAIQIIRRIINKCNYPLQDRKK